MRNSLLVFIKLVRFDYIINFVYFFVIYNCLTCVSKNDVLVYPFLNQIFYYINPLYSLSVFLLFYFLISIKNIIIILLKNNLKSNESKFNIKKIDFNTNYYLASNNYNGILLQLSYTLYNVISFKVVITYLVS